MIRQLNLSDQSLLQDVVNVFERSLGAEYLTAEKLRRYLSDSKKRLDVFFTKDSSIIGASLYEVLSDEQPSNSYIKAFQRISYLSNTMPFRVGLFGTTAVDPEWRRQGIASAFYRRRISYFKEQKCSACISLVWESGKNDSSKPLLKKLGFEELESIEDYWVQDSLDYDYECPNCGEPPCRCTATLMALDL